MNVAAADRWNEWWQAHPRLAALSGGVVGGVVLYAVSGPGLVCLWVVLVAISQWVKAAGWAPRHLWCAALGGGMLVGVLFTGYLAGEVSSSGHSLREPQVQRALALAFGFWFAGGFGGGLLGGWLRRKSETEIGVGKERWRRASASAIWGLVTLLLVNWLLTPWGWGR